MQVKMSTLAEGEKARVTGIDAECAVGDRLRILGFTEGSEVKCLHKSKKGSIAAYLICGAVMAIRREDADKVAVEFHEI